MSDRPSLRDRLRDYVDGNRQDATTVLTGTRVVLRHRVADGSPILFQAGNYLPLSNFVTDGLEKGRAMRIKRRRDLVGLPFHEVHTEEVAREVG